jgi:hypothetical protein
VLSRSKTSLGTRLISIAGHWRPGQGRAELPPEMVDNLKRIEIYDRADNIDRSRGGIGH